MGGDVWAVADAYDAYVGRWSRRVAREFIGWLAVPPGRRWLDVGCGPGTLAATVADAAAPARVTGVDMSLGFLGTAKGIGSRSWVARARPRPTRPGSTPAAGRRSAAGSQPASPARRTTPSR